MKLFIFRLFTLFVVSVSLLCCRDFSPSSYVLEFPRAPDPWITLLGEPHWRLEWLDPGGYRQITDILPGSSIEIELPTTWANAVTAWPYWPDHNLFPGLFKPAGALFPLDVSGEYLCLSWRSGPDTVFYWELTLANEQNKAKMPAFFDWLRFRELLKSGTLNEAVRKDPWLVDWRSVAERTISSNFDQRRLVPESSRSMPIPVPAGFWYGSSPFVEPLFFSDDEIPVFPIRSGINVWVSEKGILKCTNETWTFTLFLLPREPCIL